MKNFILILIILLSSCKAAKMPGSKQFDAGRLTFEVRGDGSKINLNGIYSLARDSNFISLYGPLGISLARIVTRYDSLFVADIHNKRLYRGRYYNASGSLYNIFSGIYTSNEEQLIRALCYVFDKGLKIGNENLNLQLTYKTQKRRGARFIFSTVNSSVGNYEFKIKMIGDISSKSISWNLSKYANFENIYLKLEK